MAGSKAPRPVDIYVGQRVRTLRLMKGMSQEKLGNALGLTFQQVQKYEKGANRVGASRLQQISEVLQVPVSYFFDGAPSSNGKSKKIISGDVKIEQAELTQVLSSTDGIKLIAAYATIKDPKLRACVANLAASLAKV